MGKKDTGTFYVEKYMTKHPYLTNSRILAKEAYEKMKTKGIRHFPVIEENELVGVISERDLRQVIGNDDAERVTVWELMAKNPHVVHEGTSLRQVIREMREKKYGCVVVVDEADWITGIFTTIDALALLEELMDEEPEGHHRDFASVESYLVHKAKRQSALDSIAL